MDPGAACAGNFLVFDSIIKAAPQAPLSIFESGVHWEKQKNLLGMICNCAGTNTPQIFRSHMNESSVAINDATHCPLLAIYSYGIYFESESSELRLVKSKREHPRP